MSPTLAEKQKADLQDPLFEACKGGSLDRCKKLLTQGASLHVTDADGDKAINWAITYGQIEIAAFFLEKGANIHSRIKNGTSLIHTAAWNKNLAMIQFLVNHGADVNGICMSGKVPVLHCALYAGSSECARLLVACGARINETDCDGNTALHCSASSGSTGSSQIVCALIEMGCDPNVKNKRGMTALQKAALSNHVVCAQVPIEVSSQATQDDAMKLCIKEGLSPVLALFQAREAKFAIEKMVSEISAIPSLS